MKKILPFIAASLLTASFATAQASSAPVIASSNFWSWHNLYLLGQVGWEKAQLSSISSSVNSIVAGNVLQSHTDDTGVAGRIALGYSLLPQYLDLQLGYTRYQGGYQNITMDVGADESFAGEARTRMQTVDLALEGKLPFHQFYLSGKVGGAYVHLTQSATDNADEVGSSSLVDSYSESTNTVRPLVGAGIGYHASQHVFVEADYQYLFGTGNTLLDNHPVPNTQFASLGVGYYF